MKKHSFKGRLLYKFLKRNRALDNYIKEVCHQKPGYTAVVQYKQNHDILDFFDKFNDINRSLYWRDTPQGHDYWSEMHDRFRYYLGNERYVRARML